MRPDPRTALALALAFALPACIENEEEVTIHADGAVDVLVAAKGGLSDLADGYPVPLHAPWRAQGADTLRWLEHVGPATGGDGARARAEALDWLALGGEKKDEARLAASAHFESVADWARWYAPPGVPYATAYLERSATLRVDRRGKYTVYTFERTYHGRHRSLIDIFDCTGEAVPSEMQRKFQEKEALTDPEWRYLTDVLRDYCIRSSEHFARESLGAAGGEADAPSLEPDAARRIVLGVRDRITQAISLERVVRLLETLSALSDSTQKAAKGDDSDPLADLEQELRREVRSALTEGLATEQVPAGLRNAILTKLEWGFTAADDTSDLADEKFEVKITMPGTVVSGNYDDVTDERAEWKFEAEKILEDDYVLRVVSIVE